MDVRFRVDAALLERGSFALSAELRSLLKNYTRGLAVALDLVGSSATARFHRLNSTFESREFGSWLRRNRVASGTAMVLGTVGGELENRFRIELLDPSVEAAEAAAAAAAAADADGLDAPPAPAGAAAQVRTSLAGFLAPAAGSPGAAEGGRPAGPGPEDLEDEPSEDDLDRLEREMAEDLESELAGETGPRTRRRGRKGDPETESLAPLPPPPSEHAKVDRSVLAAMAEQLCGRTHPPGDTGAFALRIAGEAAAARDGFGSLWGLGSLSGVELYEHQLIAVRKVLDEFQGRSILADEVGLGKTIEAGMVMSEYLARGLIRSFLVLAPASLVRQWQEELRSKFGIDAQTHLDGDVWSQHDFLVASLDTAKGVRHRSALRARGYDLVVVDEAHKLKNQRTRNWRFVKELEPRYLLLLTATPIQNSIEELYNLIYLVRPGLLSTRKSFKTEFVHARNKRLPRNVERLRSLVSRVMVRSRRAEANLAFTERRVDLVPVPMQGEEAALYATLDRFLRTHYATLPYFEKGLNRLTLMLLERMVTSSPRALAGTVDRLLAKGSLPPVFASGLEEIGTRARALATPAKLVATRKLLADEEPDRVLIYTQFRDTQEALAEFLEAAGQKVFRFHGGLPVVQKDRVVKEFAKTATGVLVSTDAGAEGRNLQFCRRLVNFDLPWNPMKVEQRIGRVHRLGQLRDVEIVNLFYQDSIEEYVVRLLTEKIRLFTLVVGELDSILGLARTRQDIETEIMDVYMSTDDQGELQYRFDRLGRHFEKALDEYDGMKNAQNRIFEGGGSGS